MNKTHAEVCNWIRLDGTCECWTNGYRPDAKAMTKAEMLDAKTRMLAHSEALDVSDPEMWRTRMLLIARMAIGYVEQFDGDGPEATSEGGR